jgi:hypothetical protein
MFRHEQISHLDISRFFYMGIKGKMKNITTLKHKGKDVLLVDMTNASNDEGLAAIKEASEKISKMPAKSVLLLTDSTGATYNSTTSAAMKDFSKNMTPYIRGSAVVGADGLKKLLVNAVRVVSGRDIRTFDARPEALDWLVGL